MVEGRGESQVKSRRDGSHRQAASWGSMLGRAPGGKIPAGTTISVGPIPGRWRQTNSRRGQPLGAALASNRSEMGMPATFLG